MAFYFYPISTGTREGILRLQRDAPAAAVDDAAPSARRSGTDYGRLSLARAFDSRP